MAGRWSPPTGAKLQIMQPYVFLYRAVVLGAIATLSLFVTAPAWAQLPGAVARPATQLTPASAPPAAPRSATCSVATDQARLDFPLSRMAPLLADGLPIKIVALGSSSTRGVGASTSAASYPSRLAEELVRRFPGHKFTILNRGVNGEDVGNMLARLDTVIRDKPDLVLWQIGTNSVLDGKAVQPRCLSAAGKFTRVGRGERSLSPRMGSLYSPRVLMSLPSVSDSVIRRCRINVRVEQTQSGVGQFAGGAMLGPIAVVVGRSAASAIATPSALARQA